MREIAKYVLWVIRDNVMAAPSDPISDEQLEKPPFYLAVPVVDESRSRCIMISFQHDTQTRALYIKDKLVEGGYIVWMNEYPLSKFVVCKFGKVAKTEEFSLWSPL